ncbi:MAG: filamentous hemagglutinin family protein, partial [Dinoroseobacter sp.]
MTQPVLKSQTTELHTENGLGGTAIDSNPSMNRVYRLIWSVARNCWVANAEAGRGRGRGSSSNFIAAALALSAACAQAAPDGGQVVTGTGSITQSGATTTINQATQNLTLNWKSFNIAPTETVNFLQPSASAIAVNRIFDINGTQILGRLNANGQVYLINPNGILFGQDAQVNVGALISSTLDFNDTSLNGTTRTFSGTGTGSIVNQGTINATGMGGSGGYVALLGNTVSNQGTITAPLGAVALGAGSSTILTFQNNSLVKMQTDQSVFNTFAENGGLIRADGGLVVMSAGAKDALLASVVNNTGVIEARTVENHAGTIILLGGMSAGTVNVGGTLDASAPNGGDGGFIETSAAHVKISNDVKVTTAAPAGNTGTWLIDPVDYTIASVDPGNGSSYMSNVTLENSLINTDMIIQTLSTGTGNGDIFVNSAVSWAANRLTLSAHGDININADLNASGMSSLALNFGQGAVAAGNTSQITTTNAAVNLPAGTTNFTTLQGSDGLVKAFTVITSLGAASSMTTTDLQGMNGASGANYVLGSNIDASPTSTAAFGATGFTPIAGFAGTFDGLGHTVNDLFINAGAAGSIGLFGGVGTGSVIRNVGLVGGSVSGGASTGALVGNNGTGTVNNSYATGNVAGAAGTGGLVGSNANGVISNSYATGNVSNGAAGGVGGLLGANTTGSITNNYATGSVTGGAGAGGLVGSNTSGNISNSYATGSVDGAASTGGLVGSNTTGDISNAYATGNISNG